MGEQVPRYSFDPLERRGLVFGLQPAQVGLAGAALVVAWMVVRCVAPPVGPPLALTMAIGGFGAAFWSKDGRTAASWSMSGLRWALQRVHGPVLCDDPLDGRYDHARAVASQKGHARAALPDGVELTELMPGPGESAVGVIVDRYARRWVAGMRAQGAAFSLLDPEDQDRRLDSWRVTLNSLGRPGTPIRRVQWVERTSPAGSANSFEVEHAFPAVGSSPDITAQSYLELVAGRGSGSPIHQVWLLIAVDGPESTSGQGARRAAETIRRELRLLEGQLRNAELLTTESLDGPSLACALRGAHSGGPLISRPEASWRSFRPMAEEEGWSTFRTDGMWHATYWIAEWPRIDVGPDFMSPLLMSGGRRAVSLVMAPVPPERASRDARSARTSDAAEEHLRASAGFTPSARRSREAEAAMRREEELADGHAEFRFSGYVTVSAGDRADLDLACADTEHAAQAAHLEIRRLYGRQREAFTWTLPLARGVR